MISLECSYGEAHAHEFEDDWCFAGADGQDPRGDRRWIQSTYVYLNDHFTPVWRTQTPLCDQQAVAELVKHRIVGAVYVQVFRPGHEPELLDWQYSTESDAIVKLGG